MKKPRFETEQIHGKIANRQRDCGAAVPIVQSAAFEQSTAEELRDVFVQRKFGYIYSRISNPTVAQLEERLTLLEDGVGCLAVASGMAAISTALLTILQQGDELVSGNSLFGGTYALFADVFPRFGIKVKFVEPTDLAAMEAAITPKTKAVFVESLGNPKMDMPDLRALADLAHSAGAPLVVDNTVLTPWLLRTKDFGADIVVYSTTKYISGHGHCIGGAIVDCGTFDFAAEKFSDFKVFRDKFRSFAYIAKMRKQIFINMGPSLAAHSAFLQLTGLETLAMRMNQHSANALALAEFLAQHPKVKAVNYPGLKKSHSFAVAQKQAPKGCSGLLTFEVGSQEQAFAFINHRSFVRNVANIGDAKTLVIHPASTIYADYDAATMAKMGVNERLIRVSVGIENKDDIIAEWEQALQKV